MFLTKKYYIWIKTAHSQSYQTKTTVNNRNGTYGARRIEKCYYPVYDTTQPFGRGGFGRTGFIGKRRIVRRKQKITNHKLTKYPRIIIIID